jgi:hypothetical protein
MAKRKTWLTDRNIAFGSLLVALLALALSGYFSLKQIRSTYTSYIYQQQFQLLDDFSLNAVMLDDANKKNDKGKISTISGKLISNREMAYIYLPHAMCNDVVQAVASAEKLDTTELYNWGTMFQGCAREILFDGEIITAKNEKAYCGIVESSESSKTPPANQQHDLCATFH